MYRGVLTNTSVCCETSVLAHLNFLEHSAMDFVPVALSNANRNVSGAPTYWDESRCSSSECN